MSNAKAIGQLLGLSHAPVAVKFDESPPAGIDRIDEPAVSGCTYWKLAADGRTFYTESADHLGCPVGAHTHGIDMPEESAKELEGLVGTMVDLQYISMDEVPQIPTREAPFGVAVYAPLAEAAFSPDVIIVSGSARKMMLLAEAAHAAGVPSNSSVVGRPTCAALPVAVQAQQTATNLGCIGNRVYTEMTDDELYFVIPGPKAEIIAEKLETIVNANQALESFHRERASA